MAEFSFTPDIETPEIDSSEFSFTPDENQETAKINVDNYNGMDLVGKPGEDTKPYSKMDLFLKNLFTFEVKSGEEVKERQENNTRIQALKKVRNEGFENVKWGEVGKSYVKSSLELGKKATGTFLRDYGDWAMDESDTSLMTPEEIKDVKRNNFVAQSYIKIGECIEKLFDMGLKSDLLKLDEETFKGSFVENPSMTRTLSLGASGIASVSFFAALTKITGSSKLASVILAGADNIDMYSEAREAGKTQNEALALTATGTAGTAILEKYGADQIFNRNVVVPMARQINNAMLAELFTEGFQTYYQNAIKKFGYDETQELLDGVLEASIGGWLSGGAVSAFDAGYVKLQDARGKLKDKGAADEVLDMLQEEFARELSYHRDTIEPMFQTKITESLNNLDKFVKEHEGTAEAQKALKTKAELDEVYNLVNKSLTDNGVNAEVANADAKIWQGIALWGSQETGLSPMEYINRRMPKVQKKRLAEFLNERERRVATSNESELEILRQDINRLKKGVSRKASKGLRLSQFIKKMGGINDDRGDIKSMGASVGLLNKNGISLDEATRMAWDAGYIQSTERPDVNQLLDLLSDDLGNKPVYSFNDNTKDDNRQYYLSLERALDEAGADINKDSLEVINRKLNDYKNSFAREDVAQYNPELDDFIPFQFAGPKAQTAALDKLDIAKQFETEGMDSEQIRQQTGWFKGPDTTHYIVFNSEQAKSVDNKGEWGVRNRNFYLQDAGRPKGAFAQNLDQKGVIYLFEDADASTFMHETAHFFRKELEEFGTARSKEMLQKMIEWENSEFDKRYNVQQTANGFVVTDKLGNVVYGDKKPFQSVQSAREYGRNEIFARGFEQYLRDGKAPSNYLKQAFRSFWSWLRSLYKSAKDLNVEINDNIRSVYNEIIGGADLDFYLSAPVDEVLQQRVAESKDREEYLEDVIKRAQAKPHKGVSGWIKEKTESDKGLVKWWNAAIVPISTRAKRVNIKLRNRLRAYDYAVNNKYNEYMAQVKPFLDKWEKFSEQDAIAFDLALKNSYMKKQIDIVNKYGAYDEFVQVKNLLNRLFDQAIDVGVELGYTADYFPRQVEDVDGFMAYLHGSAMASQMRRALKDADPTNTFTTEEKAEFINKYLRGFNRRDLNKPLPGNVKDRIIDVITPEMNKYYKPSMQALISYIDGMNQSIESRRFWGFEYKSIDDSIGSMVSYLVDVGLVQPEQDAEVQEILKARFKAKGVTNKYLKKQKNLSYIYLMGGINSTITQIEDISVAIYKAGFWNTATSVFSKNRKGLSREELGLEKIGQEFVEASTSSKAVNTVFKMTGLDKIDAFGKNTLINATFNKFQEMANKNEDALRARLEPILEQETNQTIQDIKNGEISENVKLLMFNELADMQPISLSEMPEYYLTSGNGRIFYMLKTFALKRIDIFRNECFDKIKQGNVKEGIQNLFRLSIIMILCGMTKDAIINIVFGRDMDLSEMFINNLLGLTGFFSKYSLYQLRDEGVEGFVSSVAIPPVFSIWSDLGRDIYKSLFTKKGKDISDYEIWKGLPLIGRFYYWWLGGGRTKIEKKKNKLK